MKKQNKTKFLFLSLALAAMIVMVWSCKDDDPSLAELRNDRIAYLEDSLRISDSLRMINAAGIVNYAINVVDGSTSSIYQNYSSRTSATKNLLSGAIVTISQFGKTLTDSTDASGMVVFNGFFRSAVNITIRKEGFTSVSYVSAVNIQDSTRTGSVTFVGNLIPIFPLTGANTATISGRVTFESDLTNRVREFVPQSEGNIITASIDATDSDFEDKFLTDNIKFDYTPNCGCEFIYVGNILQASYQTGAIGSISSATGDYTVTVPAAIDGLPLSLSYSDLAGNQTLFQLDASDQNTVAKRVVYTANPFATPAALPNSGDAQVSFISHAGDDGNPNNIDFGEAAATAIISANAGTIERINVTNGGSGYSGAPIVQINGNGTGATAVATVGLNGTVSGITITNPGTGYTTASATLISGGTSGTADATLSTTLDQVFSITLTAGGTGYTSAPTVTFTGGGSGSGASATATVDNGRVISVIVQTRGSGYTGAPTIGFTGGGGTGATATALMGSGIAQVNVTGGGANHVVAPNVFFEAPALPGGTLAQGTAIIDPVTRSVVGVDVTNAGSGYTAGQLPITVTFNSGSGAVTQTFLTGGSVISFNVTDEGQEYAYRPTVIVGRTSTGNGSGATAEAVMQNGRVVGINVINGGTGYTSSPSVEIVSGGGAVAYPIVNASGSVTGYTVVKGGSGYNGPPRVVVTSINGSGATATAVVSPEGVLTAVNAVLTGSNYEAGNTPATELPFTATYGNSIETRPGLKYINDIYYGTGTTREQ
jgi:hypothetical protein